MGDSSLGTGAKRVAPSLIFGIAASAMTMSAIDQTIVSTILVRLHTDLHAPISWTSWTITGYLLGFALALPIAGRVSDQFGRKRVYLACIGIFTVASFFCAIANNIYVLIAFRSIQALGGGALMPSGIGLITDHFGPNRDRAVGALSSVTPIGAIAGPVLGGVIISYWSWRAVFLINIPIGIIVFLLTLRFVPNSRPKEVPSPDLIGIALLTGIILPLMYGITTLGGRSSSLLEPQTCVPILVAVVCGFFFVRHARVDEAPIIPLRLLSSGGFGKLNIINILYGGCAIGITSLLPLYASERYRFAATRAGTVLSYRFLGGVIVAGLTAFLIRRVGYRRPMILGFVFAAIGMVMVSIDMSALNIYLWIALGSAVMGIGNGMAAPASNNTMLSNAPKEAGSISGLRGLARQFGAICVISITTALATRSGNEGLVIGHAFFFLAILDVLVIIPLAFAIPDHRGRW